MFKVMVVEDESVVLSNIGEILAMFNLDCCLGHDGENAFKQLSGMLDSGAALPDLIISDLMMPNLDGFGLLERVRKSEAMKRIPFVILSARSDPSDLKQAFALGADDYLVKPFDVTDLLDLINKWKLVSSEEARMS